MPPYSQPSRAIGAYKAIIDQLAAETSHGVSERLVVEEEYKSAACLHPNPLSFPIRVLKIGPGETIAALVLIGLGIVFGIKRKPCSSTFTVEVLSWRGLVTYYVLFFIHLESRRVSLAGITRHPDQGWMQTNGAQRDRGELGIPRSAAVRTA